MSSSTSASDERSRYRKRLLAVVLLAGCALTVMAVLPDRKENTAIEEDRYWAIKTHHWGPVLDMVLVGDSRTYIGISPACMKAVLKDYRIGNFGFDGGGLNPVMYRAAGKLLDPSSPRKTIVLGVSPYALTPKAGKNERYLQEKQRSKAEVLARCHLTGLRWVFRKVSIDELLGGGPPDPGFEFFQDFHEDGWVACNLKPELPELTLPSYRFMFYRSQVSKDLCRQLVDAVRQWSQQGIRVFGLRIPTTAAMREIEDELSGFEEAGFVRDFEAAGGIWLAFSSEGYRSYDASHLNEESARRFSIVLAESIAQYSGSASAPLQVGGRQQEGTVR